jgi:hypothetical protein
MRGWPFYTKSLVWMPSPAFYNLRRAYLCRGSPERGTAIDAQCRTFLCRGSPTRGMATGASAAQLQTSHTAAHLRRRHTGRSPTLLRGCPEPATEERWVHQQVKALLEAAAAQQAKNSASRQRSEQGRAGAPSAHGSNPPPSQH